MQGWECPKCHKVYAPHVDECKHCNAENSEDIIMPTPVIPLPITVPTIPHQPIIYRHIHNPFDPPLIPTWGNFTITSTGSGMHFQ